MVGVPLFALALMANAHGLASDLSAAFDGASGASRITTAVAGLLTCLFYLFLVWAYLTRTETRATSRVWAAHGAALVATPLPAVIPLLADDATPDASRAAVANVLLVAGLGWSLWAVRHLRRSFSILAQARAVVSSGPYRLLRHPLYVGEIVAALGLVVLAATTTALAIWLLLCLLQGYRAAREEEVLTANLPDYARYRSTTALLIPGLF